MQLFYYYLLFSPKQQVRHEKTERETETPICLSIPGGSFIITAVQKLKDENGSGKNF